MECAWRPDWFTAAVLAMTAGLMSLAGHACA